MITALTFMITATEGAVIMNVRPVIMKIGPGIQEHDVPWVGYPRLRAPVDDAEEVCLCVLPAWPSCSPRPL